MKTFAYMVALSMAISAPYLGSQTIAPSDLPAKPVESAPDSTAAPDRTDGGSQVRIVRLSQTNGDVELDRKTGRGFEAGYTNLPIVQGATLRTKEGVAEVELEDNSSIRLGSNSIVVFRELSRGSSGATNSAIEVLKGTVYVSRTSTKGNVFTLAFGQSKVDLLPSSHIRLSIGDHDTQLAVLEGTANLVQATGGMSVSKKNTLIYASNNTVAPTLVHTIEGYPLDNWDKIAVDYHKRTANSFASGASGFAYGSNDLNYYGSFADLPGCGSVWRPYFASAAWDPYSNGMWAWYAGTGYSWVSPYPWGWTPFHSGNWQQCGNGAWGWNPNGAWTGLRNQPVLLSPKQGLPRPKPPMPPTSGHPTLLFVNTRPITPSSHIDSNTFVFRKDSAGLGIPRQTFGKLAGVSSGVEKHGTVSAPAFSAGALSALPVNRGSGPSTSARSTTVTSGMNTPSGMRGNTAPQASTATASHSTSPTSASSGSASSSRH